jgi:CRISPR/Cas system-associated protein Cas10 (large subunit of type III CRISPR-Cas system)
MSTNKCPLCESECIIKVVTMEDENWCEVDVCKMCGAMYPRGRKVVQVKERKRTKAKAKAKQTKKNPKKRK